jgi:hypothetical protein
MDFNPFSLLFSGLFGILGFFYLKRGKAEARIMLMIAGLGLMVYPFVISGPWPTFLVGLLIACLPWGADKLGVDF